MMNNETKYTPGPWHVDASGLLAALNRAALALKLAEDLELGGYGQTAYWEEYHAAGEQALDALRSAVGPQSDSDYANLRAKASTQ